MSKTTFEKLGIPYEERNGIFYPVLVAGTEKVDIDAGKYGRMWIKYIKEEYPMRYKSLVRFGELEERANEVNETAYELFDDIEAKWLKKHKPENPDSFTELCDSLLFNTSLPLRFESSKSSFSLDADADVSTVLETSIGQGKTLVTPMHMALVVSAIANDGVLMNPYLIDHTENYNGIVVDAYEPTEYGTLLSAEDASLMQTFMREVVEDGTGERLLGQSYAASGKTGTAEFSTSSKASHAWFVGYAHREDKEDIAVAVIVEDSGSGSEYAVPIAKKIFDAYYQ